tara:strand:+ start:484 stop:1404 length:921 start_codon:yes stop_codon:yes gene_type:complete
MKKIILFFLLFIAVSCSKSNDQSLQVEPINQITEIRDWTEFIDFREGDIPLLIISVHGGNIEPEWIQTRTCSEATVVRDSYTRDVALQIESELKIKGYSPFIILNDLHRKKLDLNRSLNNANCGDQTTRPYWELFHKQVEDFRMEIQNQFGSGLVIDIHGQSHEEQRIELGYLLSSSDLRMNNPIINSLDFKNKSSVKGILNNNLNNLKLIDLLSGEFSMGNFLTLKGYASVPSKEDIAPKQGELYFSGGYNTATYGSRDSGSVDAIQIELNMIGVRDTSENRTIFSKDFAEVLITYLRTYYKSDL